MMRVILLILFALVNVLPLSCQVGMETVAATGGYPAVWPAGPGKDTVPEC